MGWLVVWRRIEVSICACWFPVDCIMESLLRCPGTVVCCSSSLFCKFNIIVSEPTQWCCFWFVIRTAVLWLWDIGCLVNRWNNNTAILSVYNFVALPVARREPENVVLGVMSVARRSLCWRNFINFACCVEMTKRITMFVSQQTAYSADMMQQNLRSEVRKQQRIVHSHSQGPPRQPNSASLTCGRGSSRPFIHCLTFHN